MINTLLYNKNLPFPHISFSLILSCLIISIPIFFNDVLYAFFAANAGIAYPWQYLTSVFAHGPEPPLLIHLILNLLIILFCVISTENLLSTWRSFVILIFTAILITIISFETINFYNGISYFVFSTIPFFIALIINEYKNNRIKFWKDLYYILGIFLLLLVFIFYPTYFSINESILCERNILHIISMITGIIFF